MKSLVLVGVQHSGKTAAGRLLAQRMQCDFFDTDALIEKNCGLSCRELYAQKGADGFRKAEFDVCRVLYERFCSAKTVSGASPSGCVIASGGGICDNPRAFLLLKQIGVCVHLLVSEDTAFSRICARAKRTGYFPAYIEVQNCRNDDERKTVFSELYKRRVAVYKKCAALHIQTEGLSVARVCDALFSAVYGGNRF